MCYRTCLRGRMGAYESRRVHRRTGKGTLVKKGEDIAMAKAKILELESTSTFRCSTTTTGAPNQTLPLAVGTVTEPGKRWPLGSAISPQTRLRMLL